MGLTILTALALAGGAPEAADAAAPCRNSQEHPTFISCNLEIRTQGGDCPFDSLFVKSPAGCCPVAPLLAKGAKNGCPVCLRVDAGAEAPGRVLLKGVPHDAVQAPAAPAVAGKLIFKKRTASPAPSGPRLHEHVAPGATYVETLVRATYELPPDRAQALSEFLTRHVGRTADARVDGHRLTVTASPEAQRTVAQFVALVSSQPDEASGKTAATCQHAPVAHCTDGAPALRRAGGRIVQAAARRPAKAAPAASEHGSDTRTLELVLSGTGGPPTAWEVTTTGVKRLATQRTGNGLRISLPASARRAAVLITDNRPLIARLQEGIREALDEVPAEPEPFVPPEPLP